MQFAEFGIPATPAPKMQQAYTQQPQAPMVTCSLKVVYTAKLIFQVYYCPPAEPEPTPFWSRFLWSLAAVSGTAASVTYLYYRAWEPFLC